MSQKIIDSLGIPKDQLDEINDHVIDFMDDNNLYFDKEENLLYKIESLSFYYYNNKKIPPHPIRFFCDSAQFMMIFQRYH